VWTEGDMLRAYYTRAEMQGGRSVPVCIRLGNEETTGYGKDEPGPEPGTYELNRNVAFIVVDHFDRPY
jgi:hypothetical protein